MGKNLRELCFREQFGAVVVAIQRNGETLREQLAQEILRERDEILALDTRPQLEKLASSPDFVVREVGVMEAAVAPRSDVAGRTLGELAFRGRYGLQVLAIWREGNPIHTNLAHLVLRFGDTLLLQGSWERVRRLSAEPDFVVLSQTA